MDNNKNVIIGVLAVLLIVGGGYYFSKNKQNKEPNVISEEQTESSKTTIVTTTPNPSIKPSAPKVDTSSKNTTSSSTAAVTGIVNPNGAYTTYWFEYGESTNLGSRTTPQPIGSGYALIESPAYITGLKANTLYNYRLSASNHFATVNGEINTFQTNNTPAVKVSAPTARTNSATNVSTTNANVNGQVNPNGGTTNYWFEYGTDNSLGNVTSFQSAGSGNSSISISSPFSGLQPATTYYFRLNAQNPYATVNGSILNFTTQGPASPSKPTISSNGTSDVNSTSATLTGSINTNGAETSYWFEYSKDSSLSGAVIATPSQVIDVSMGTKSIQTTINNLSKNTKYYYRLMGRNTQGTTQGSIQSFKTRP